MNNQTPLSEQLIKLEELIQAAQPQISKQFFDFIVAEFREAKTVRAVLQIEALIIARLQSEADRIFWNLIKKIIEIVF